MLLDTNILSELMRPEPSPGVIEWLDRQPQNKLFISAITKAEIELGIALLPAGKRRERLSTAADAMFAEFTGRCLPFDEPAASHYARLVAAGMNNGRPVSVENAQIASVSLVHDLSLVTRNTRDFEGIDNLRLINPWDLTAEPPE
ncbi:MAG: type II toxin-antitoxin system VapC family toxin [Desulfobia sp.]